MVEVERTLGVGPERDDSGRDHLRIGAWSIEHPGQKIDYAQVFPRQFAAASRATSSTEEAAQEDQRGHP